MAEIQPLILQYSARSRVQLIAIHEYLLERDPKAAVRVSEAIEDAAEMIRRFPYAARVGDSPGTREWVVRGLPYIIVYLNIFHGAQRR